MTRAGWPPTPSTPGIGWMRWRTSSTTWSNAFGGRSAFWMSRGVAVSEPMTGEAGATLTQAVEELAEAVTALRADLSKRTRRLWIWVLSAVAVGTVALTVVIVYLAGAVMDLRQNERATCVAVASVGQWQLPATASPLARQIVSTHADAARILGCAK